MKEYKICKIKKLYEQTDKYTENNNTHTYAHNYVQIHYCIRSEWKAVGFEKLKVIWTQLTATCEIVTATYN